jgi:putative hydrolase
MLIAVCKKYEVPTILGSDAHISFQIADYERLYPLLAETEFPVLHTVATTEVDA